jgi:hypothetical protein
MHATYGWTAAGKLPCSQDIRPTSPRIGTIPQCVPPLGRLAQRCLLLCCAHALLTTALDANAMPPQESPQEFPSTAVVGGPSPVHSLLPIQLLYFQFTPERALTLPRGMWNGRFALKLPTVDEDRALGSGEVDVALGVALEKTFGVVRFYFNTALMMPTGNPFSGSGIDSLPMLSTFLTGEYRLTERLSLLLQLNGVTSPVRNMGFDIDRPTFEILAGFNGALPGLPEIWQAGFMEDLNDTNRIADFALFMSWSIFFGHRASPTR